LHCSNSMRQVLPGDITVDQTVAGETLNAAAGTFNGDGTETLGFGIFCNIAPGDCGSGIQTFSDNLVFPRCECDDC